MFNIERLEWILNVIFLIHPYCFGMVCGIGSNLIFVKMSQGG